MKALSPNDGHAVERISAPGRIVGAVLLTGGMMQASTSTGSTVVTLGVLQPFDADSLLQFLRRRAISGIESVDDRSYSRTMRLPAGPAAIRLEVGAASVEAHLWVAEPTDLAMALQRCRWLLDLDTDLSAVEDHLRTDPHLAPSLRANPGLRVPGHVDGFEVAVRAVVGQQISVAGARTILGRLVREYGEAVADAPQPLTHLFPSPEGLAGADPERLPMPRSRGRALVAVAVAVARGEVVLDRSVDLPDARRALLALPGIGPWTADYIALRALGDPDVFMGTDLGVRQGLARMGLRDAGSDVFQRWSPWRSYALMHVWKSLDAEPT